MLAPSNSSDLESKPIETDIVKKIEIKKAKVLYENYNQVYVKCDDFRFREVRSKATFFYNPTFEYYICGKDVLTEVGELSNEN